MAELRISGKTLEWDRLPDGRFGISIGTRAILADGTSTEAPDLLFILTAEEEADLKHSLTSLHLVQANGGGNGRGIAE